jgi:hypothetical protein
MGIGARLRAQNADLRIENRIGKRKLGKRRILLDDD